MSLVSVCVSLCHFCLSVHIISCQISVVLNHSASCCNLKSWTSGTKYVFVCSRPFAVVLWLCHFNSHRTSFTRQPIRLRNWRKTVITDAHRLVTFGSVLRTDYRRVTFGSFYSWIMAMGPRLTLTQRRYMGWVVNGDVSQPARNTQPNRRGMGA